jgi:hypothetical protein
MTTSLPMNETKQLPFTNFDHLLCDMDGSSPRQPCKPPSGNDCLMSISRHWLRARDLTMHCSTSRKTIGLRRRQIAIRRRSRFLRVPWSGYSPSNTYGAGFRRSQHELSLSDAFFVSILCDQVSFYCPSCRQMTVQIRTGLPKILLKAEVVHRTSCILY